MRDFIDSSLLVSGSEITPTPGVIDEARLRTAIESRVRLYGGAPKIFITDVESGAISTPAQVRAFPWCQMFDIIDDTLRSLDIPLGDSALAQYDLCPRADSDDWDEWCEAIKYLKGAGVLNRLNYFVVNLYTYEGCEKQAKMIQNRTKEIAFLKSIRSSKNRLVLMMVTQRTIDTNRLLTRDEIRQNMADGKSIGFEGVTVFAPDVDSALSQGDAWDQLVRDTPDNFSLVQAVPIRDAGYRAALRECI